jgi:phosphotriesterase-related protein
MSVNTVSGTIEPDELGFTLMHEHVHTASPGVREAYPHTYDRDAAMERALVQLRRAKDAGVKTIVEPATIDLGRDVRFSADAAAATGIQIVAATGLYLRVPSYFLQIGVDRTVDVMMHDVEHGLEGTEILAGMIKCAIHEELNPAAELSLRAGARLHRRSGLPITIHTSGEHRTGLVACDVMEQEGVEPETVVIGHAGDSVDLDYLRQMLDRGFVLGMDRFGMDRVQATDARVEVVARLCAEGYARQLVVSHDCVCFSDWLTPEGMANLFGSEWNMDLVPLRVMPALRAAGVSQSDIDEMTVSTPARMLGAKG